MKTIFEKGFKKVYISGPIFGQQDGNKNAFKEAELKFNAMNFEAVNPHELHGIDWENQWNEKLSKREITVMEHWAGYMKTDIAALVKCDFLALLPNWESSKGANIEIAIAKSLGMPIINATDMQEVTTNINFGINKSQK